MKVAVSLAMLLTVFAGLSLAQRRSITNAELEKFRQKRLQAERDYKENYDKMGFPSPEELQRQIEQSRTERFALAERLAKERIEQERLAIERERVDVERENLALQRQAMEWSAAAQNSYNDDWFYNYGYFPGYYYPGFGRGFRGGRGHGFLGQPRSVGNGIPIVDYGYGGRGGRINMGSRGR